MKAYPEYKESGSEIIKQIPSHWGIVPLKFVGKIILGKMLTPEDKGGYTEKSYLRAKNIGWETVDAEDIKTMWFSPYELGQYRLQQNDLLISEGGEVGRTAIWNSELDECYIQNSVHKLTLYQEHNPRYYLYHSQVFGKTGYYDSIVNRVSIAHLTGEKLKDIRFVVPPLQEQQAIADFLDCKTAQIDALIEKKQRQIDLLQEQRMALINHAVTKGLNPDVPMKDSSVEWYGEIPQHWEMKRLGRITSVIMDIDHKMPLAVEDGIPFLSAKDLLNDGTLNFEKDIKKISEEDFQKLSRKVQPKRNDIIYSRIGARLGKARLVETDQRFLVSYSCCVVRVLEELALPEYICFIMDSEILLTEAKARTVGIGVPDLGLGEIAKFPIPMPPKPEQEAILKFLKKNDAKIKLGIKDISNQIDLLNEYRTALISEAVTGKIDVRETIHE